MVLSIGLSIITISNLLSDMIIQNLTFFLDIFGTSPCYAHGLTANIKHKFYTIHNDNFHFTESVTMGGTGQHTRGEYTVQRIQQCINCYLSKSCIEADIVFYFMTLSISKTTQHCKLLGMTAL